jgi:3-hydroxybutyryl-CoA dehydratase
MRAPVTLSMDDAPEVRRISPVTQTDIVRFAGAGGDFNPLHHDPAAAAAAGFPAVIAMGQFQAGALAGLLSDWVGVEHVRSFSVRFVSPVAVGDTLELSARVSGVGNGLATIELVAAVGERTVVIGVATAIVSA